MRPAALLASSMVILLGCADNALLDVEIDLPPAADVVAVVEARPASSYDFDATWAPTDAYPAARFPLDAAATSLAAVSILAETPTQNVLLQVRFCNHGVCDDASPTLCYSLDRPFHQGRRSRYRDMVTTIPSAVPVGGVCSLPPRLIDRCEIGCAANDDWLSGSWFCEGQEHVCDR